MIKEIRPTVYSRASTSITSDVYILGELGDVQDYTEHFQTLREAAEGDTIHIYINNVGGRVDTAVQYVNCMRNSQAKVVAHIEGLCHSAATYIFLTADEWVVNKNCLMLIHNYSGGAYGKGADLKLQVDANHNWITTLMEDIYLPFLSTDELDEVVRNGDMWLTSEKILERLSAVVEHRELLVAEQEAIALENVKEKLKEFADADTSTENSESVSGSSEELENISGVGLGEVSEERPSEDSVG